MVTCYRSNRKLIQRVVTGIRARLPRGLRPPSGEKGIDMLTPGYLGVKVIGCPADSCVVFLRVFY